MEPPGHMTLRNDLWCCLRCKRIPLEELEPLLDSPYSLLPALEDGYFSDINITATNGKQVTDLHILKKQPLCPYFIL